MDPLRLRDLGIISEDEIRAMMMQTTHSSGVKIRLVTICECTREMIVPNYLPFIRVPIYPKPGQYFIPNPPFGPIVTTERVFQRYGYDKDGVMIYKEVYENPGEKTTIVPDLEDEG